MIRRIAITVASATGGTATATASTTTDNPINGLLRAIYLAYTDSPPAATTDVTIVGATSPALALLTVSNAATDGWFYPVGQAVTPANATLTNAGAPLPLDDRVKVTIAQANNGDGVVATLVYEDLQAG